VSPVSLRYLILGVSTSLTEDSATYVGSPLFFEFQLSVPRLAPPCAARRRYAWVSWLAQAAGDLVRERHSSVYFYCAFLPSDRREKPSEDWGKMSKLFTKPRNISQVKRVPWNRARAPSVVMGKDKLLTMSWAHHCGQKFAMMPLGCNGQRQPETEP